VIKFLNDLLLLLHVKRLSDIGERNAIKLISQYLKQGKDSLGLGDDCAAIKMGDNYILITTDMISQKTHISKVMTPFSIGWFVVAINLSDIAAKGGIPIGIVLSYGLTKDTSDDFLIDLTKGANFCANKFDTYIIGGDTKETTETVICGTALGIVDVDEFLPRKGACVDDIVAVTGPVGRAGAGYLSFKNKILNEDFSRFLFEPVPRLKEGILLSKQKCVTSCMDLSDGLSSSLYQLSEINGLGFEIFKDKIPISSELLLFKDKDKDLNVFDYAIHFGGDYELLLTIPKNFFDDTKKKMNSIGSNLYEIGRVIGKREVVLRNFNKKEKLENMGYEHFKKNFF